MKYKLFFLTIFIIVLISVFKADGEEEMAVSEGFKEYVIKVCPAFKNATGRRREQLAAFFQLAGKIQDKDRREKVRRLFDLSDKEDSKLLEQLLLETEEPLNVRERLGLEVIFLAHGPHSVPWLLERYPNAKPLSKAAIIIILSRLEFKEVYEFMIDKLEDKTEVPNEIAQIRSPYADRYHHYRICDYAYTTFHNNIGYRDKLISLPDIDHHESFDQRNRKRAILSTWFSDPNNTKWSEFLSTKPSALLQISQKPQLVETKKLGPTVWVILIAAATGIFAVSLLLLLKKKARSRGKSRAT